MTSLTVVWERLNKVGKWCPYTSEVCQLLEQSFGKSLNSVCLGDADQNLRAYTVNLKDMLQMSESSGKTYEVRRRLCGENSTAANAIMWQWRGDSHGVWHCYSSNVVDLIESTFKSGEEELDLSKHFAGYPYEINFVSMVQKNKRTRYHRPIRRLNTISYPKAKVQNGNAPTCTEASAGVCENSLTGTPDGACASKTPSKTSFSKQVTNLWNKLKKSPEPVSNPVAPSSPESSANKKQCTSNLYPSLMEVENDVCVILPDGTQTTMGSSNHESSNKECIYATVNGEPWKSPWPPSVPDSKLKPVPGINPLHVENKKSKKKGRRKNATVEEPTAPLADRMDILSQFTEELTVAPTESNTDEECVICYESLNKGSAYDGDTTVLKLLLCSHVFHKSCIKALYESGSKNNHLQCPLCKTIHGIKCGNQPPGTMVYHVLPFSLPGYPDCDTIRIIYHINTGIQGPEHPNPGHQYSARGFPRRCYLPDNEMGRKVLRLLVTAWERRLIFTIGTSTTTGEQNTVTWNEIHHKTEFGCNRYGHGFPDPNYFDNIIAELAAHGVTESTYSWYPV